MSVISSNSLSQLVTQSTRLTWRVGDVTSWLAALLYTRWLKAKFHYASWFGAGSKLVRSRIPLRYLVRTSFEPASNQVRTSFEPDSVMEFGRKSYFQWRVHWNFVHWNLFSVNGFTENAEAIFYFQWRVHWNYEHWDLCSASSFAENKLNKV